MAILTRLLTTRIVANNESLFESNRRTPSEESVLRFLILRMSDGDNEKNATSEPETSAEMSNSNTELNNITHTWSEKP